MTEELAICCACDRYIETTTMRIRVDIDPQYGKELWTNAICEPCLKDALLLRIFKPF